MSKKRDDRRKQPEFLFVFNGDNSMKSSTDFSPSAGAAANRHTASSTLTKLHRERMLEELKEFGC